MENEERPAKDENAATNEAGTAAPEANRSDEGEFQLKIRKLEMPVRPRGVLAE